jgi:hypothetical protein
VKGNIVSSQIDEIATLVRDWQGKKARAEQLWADTQEARRSARETDNPFWAERSDRLTDEAARVSGEATDLRADIEERIGALEDQGLTSASEALRLADVVEGFDRGIARRILQRGGEDFQDPRFQRRLDLLLATPGAAASPLPLGEEPPAPAGGRWPLLAVRIVAGLLLLILLIAVVAVILTGLGSG